MSNNNALFFALIPCAGAGLRANLGVAHQLPKQYQLVAGKPMVQHTVDAFRAMGPVLAGIWVVLSPDDTDFINACPGFGATGEVISNTGGASRAASVLNGLKALRGHAALTDWVLVHDAARCLITPVQIAGLIDACKDDEVGGLLAQKLPDTLKSGTDGRVESTIDRSDKWLAQTPQMFRLGALIEALEAAGDAVTDESSAMEAQGLKPLLVCGSVQNFKVTYPEDFALAEAILKSRMKVSP